MSNERRRAYVRLTPELLIDLLKSTVHVERDGRLLTVTSDMPKDAKAIRGWVRSAVWEQGDLCVMFESESLDPVPMGEQCPEFRVTMTQEPDLPRHVSEPEPAYSTGEMEP